MSPTTAARYIPHGKGQQEPVELASRTKQRAEHLAFRIASRPRPQRDYELAVRQATKLRCKAHVWNRGLQWNETEPNPEQTGVAPLSMALKWKGGQIQ